MSLVLCVVTCVLWARTYWVRDARFSAWQGEINPAVARWVQLHSERGSVVVHWGRATHLGPSAAIDAGIERNMRSSGGTGFDIHAVPWMGVWPGGERASGQNATARWEQAHVQIPYWLPALLTAILPANWLIRRSRRRRLAMVGRCRGCGYDLRATPDQCPECGAMPTGGT